MPPSQLILASASPRRQQLLQQLGLSFVTVEQDIDESLRPAEPALDYVQRMAREKALSATAALPADAETLIIAADTIVVCDGEVLGKPRDEADACRMLLQLSDREHQVMSAVSVNKPNLSRTALSTSSVCLRPISAQEASRYWQTGEPLGKAGGYAIQGLAAVFVTRLEGSYSGVMGLPLFETAALLREFGVECLPVGT